MKNFKLILKSLVNNDAAIDGARKKPWYFAIIIFFISIIVSLVPTGVTSLKLHLDKNFDNTTYCTQEAVTAFSEYLNTNEIKMRVVHDKKAKNDYLLCDPELNYRYEAEIGDKKITQFVFTYSENESVNDKKLLIEETYNCSYFIFTSNTIHIKIVDQNTIAQPSGAKATVAFEALCTNAYKKIGENQIKEAYVLVEGNYTKTLENTWENWKKLLRDFYREKRLTDAGIDVGVIAIVDLSILLIMGFMVWILCRGKNNPYRLFTVWDCFKISFWAGLSPALLTCGLGFLFGAKILFPLLLGVRVMWLTMKSLRPDGSGYAAN